MNSLTPSLDAALKNKGPFIKSAPANHEAVEALNALNCDGSGAAAEEAAAILLRFLKASGNEDVANAYYNASDRNIKRAGTK